MYSAYWKQSEKGVKRGTLEVAANYSTMELMEEVKNALRRMKNSKAVGPDELPVEVWKCM